MKVYDIIRAMNPETLSWWADVLTVYLVLNVFVLTLAVGVGLGFGWWYLRKGRRKLVMPLLMAQVYTLRVQRVTMRVTDAIAGVPIALHAATARVKTTAQALARGKGVS
jgi:hypothetical protein